jgi:hypothetical protein
MSLVMALLVWACAPRDPKGPGVDPPVDDSADSDPADTDGSDTDGADTGEPLPDCAPGTMAIVGRQVHADLQAALDVAVPGDVIELCPGEWTGNWWATPEGALELRGRTGRAEDVVLRPPPSQAVLSVRGEEPHLTLRHLTMTNAGGDSYAAALSVTGRLTDPRGSLTLDGVVVSDFPDKWQVPVVTGTGLGRVELVDSTFTRLEAVESTPVLFHLVEGPVIVERCVFSENRGSKQGALLVARESWSEAAWSLRVSDTVFEGNAAMSEGNGVALMVSHEAPGTADVVIERSAFLDNFVRADVFEDWFPDRGGALYVGSAWRSGALTLAVSDTRFEGNAADHVSQVRLFRHGEGDPWAASFTRVTLKGGRGTLTADELGGECVNAAMEISAAQAELAVTLTEVDVGAGASANECTPFRDCLPAPTGLVSGDLLVPGGDVCP